MHWFVFSRCIVLHCKLQDPLEQSICPHRPWSFQRPPAVDACTLFAMPLPAHGRGLCLTAVTALLCQTAGQGLFRGSCNGEQSCTSAPDSCDKLTDDMMSCQSSVWQSRTPATVIAIKGNRDVALLVMPCQAVRYSPPLPWNGEGEQSFQGCWESWEHFCCTTCDCLCFMEHHKEVLVWNSSFVVEDLPFL